MSNVDGFLDFPFDFHRLFIKDFDSFPVNLISHEFFGPEKVQNDAKERREEKQSLYDLTFLYWLIWSDLHCNS